MHNESCERIVRTGAQTHGKPPGGRDSRKQSGTHARATDFTQPAVIIFTHSSKDYFQTCIFLQRPSHIKQRDLPCISLRLTNDPHTDNIKPVDVGLHEDALEQDHGYGFPGPNTWGGQHAEVVAQWAAAITYLHIYECDDFSMGIFCLPTSAVIPLHNHPGMTVFSKLLFGSMHIKAYDWVNPVNTEQNAYQSPLRLAKLKVDTVFSAPSTTSILYPTTGGNIHSFRAVTSCAVLDVLGPPYSDIAGRHCTYYRDYSCWSLPEDDNTIPDDDYRGFAWLEEIERPSDFFVTGAPYHGPRVDA